MAGINVKVPTKTLIKKLQERVVLIKKNYAYQEKHEANYRASLKKWEDAQKAIPKTLKPSEISVGNVSNYGDYKGKVRVEVTYWVTPKSPQPQRDYDDMNQYHYKQTVEAIENSIRILSMTEEEYVNTSTFKQVSQYL